MLKKEFLELTHKTDSEVNDEDYQKIESLYNELPGMDKQDFCDLLINDLPSLLAEATERIRTMQAHVKQLEDDKAKLTEGILTYEYTDALHTVYGLKGTIKMKLDRGLSLDAAEAEYVKAHLQ
jgi:hypothetical protein